MLISTDNADNLVPFTTLEEAIESLVADSLSCEISANSSIDTNYTITIPKFYALATSKTRNKIFFSGECEPIIIIPTETADKDYLFHLESFSLEGEAFRTEHMFLVKKGTIQLTNIKVVDNTTGIIILEDNTNCIVSSLTMTECRMSSRPLFLFNKPNIVDVSDVTIHDPLTIPIPANTTSCSCGESLVSGFFFHLHLTDDSFATFRRCNFTATNVPSKINSVVLSVYFENSLNLVLQDIYISECVSLSSPYYMYFEGPKVKSILQSTIYEHKWTINMSTLHFTSAEAIGGKDTENVEEEPLDLLPVFFYQSSTIYASIPSLELACITQNDQHTCGSRELPCATILTSQTHLDPNHADRTIVVLGQCFLFNKTPVFSISLKADTQEPQTQALLVLDHNTTASTTDTELLLCTGVNSFTYINFRLISQIIYCDNIIQLDSGSLELTHISFTTVHDSIPIRFITQSSGTLILSSSAFESLEESILLSSSLSQIIIQNSSFGVINTPKNQFMTISGTSSLDSTILIHDSFFSFDLQSDGIRDSRISITTCSLTIVDTSFSESSPRKGDTICTMTYPGIAITDCTTTISTSEFKGFKNGALLISGHEEHSTTLDTVKFLQNTADFAHFPSLKKNIDCRDSAVIKLRNVILDSEVQTDSHIAQNDVQPTFWIHSGECTVSFLDDETWNVPNFLPALHSVSSTVTPSAVTVVLVGQLLIPCDFSVEVFSMERTVGTTASLAANGEIEVGTKVSDTLFLLESFVSVYSVIYTSSHAVNESTGSVSVPISVFSNETLDYFFRLTLSTCAPDCSTNVLTDLGFLVKLRDRDPGKFVLSSAALWSIIGSVVGVFVIGMGILVIILVYTNHLKEQEKLRQLEAQQQKQRELEKEKERQRKHRELQRGKRQAERSRSPQSDRPFILDRDLSTIAEDVSVRWSEYSAEPIHQEMDMVEEWEEGEEYEDGEEFEEGEDVDEEEEPNIDWSMFVNPDPQTKEMLDTTEKIMRGVFPDFSFSSFLEKQMIQKVDPPV